MRADTPSKKRAVMERLLAVWLQTTDMRLGQMLENARCGISDDLYYLEDEDLAKKLESWIADRIARGLRT